MPEIEDVTEELAGASLAGGAGAGGAAGSEHGSHSEAPAAAGTAGARGASAAAEDSSAGGEAAAETKDGEAAKELTPEELAQQEAALEQAQAIKLEGNALFAEFKYEEALGKYTEAIETAPDGHKEQAVFYNNRATCYFKLNQMGSVIADCSAALRIDPDYAKCLLRRAQANETEKKVVEAFDDFSRVLTLDSSNSLAKAACRRLEGPATAERERQKEEMMGKLKDLGNTILGKFGMSLDNFKATQDPATGGYSIHFQQ